MTKHRFIQTAILLPLGLMLALLTAAYTTMVFVQEDTYFDKEYDQTLKTAHEYYQQRLSNTAQAMGGLADLLLQDKQLLAIWSSQDRPKLLEYCRPLAEPMRTQNQITHFYFIGPDRRCFLRLHKPEESGDGIDRFTLREAERTGKETWGVELGRFGMFTLRYVHPVVRGGKLLGYLELGTEIDPILREVQKITQINFVLVVKKQWLNRKDWESGMALLGRPGYWNQLPDAVITQSTFHKIPAEIVDGLLDDQHSLKDHESDIVVNHQTYRVGQMPLVDAAGRCIGDLLMFYDIYAQKAWQERMIYLLIGFSVTASLIFILISGVILHRVRKRLAESELQVAQEQEALRVSEERFRCIATSAQDAIVVVDPRGRITFWSSAATEIFGYSAEEALNREVHTLLAPEESRSRFRKSFSRFRTPGEAAPAPCTVELEARRKNGEIRAVEVSFSTFQWQQHWHTIAIFRDITSRKCNETTLRQAIQQAQAANYAKSHFLANMSREIRSPLNVILGFTELLDEDCQELSPAERHEFLKTIYTSGQQLLNLINDILDLSKIEAEGVEVDRRCCHPLEVLGYVLSLLRVRALEKHITLESEWPCGAPESIHTDPDRLRQLLIHLVDNAIKFTDVGGVRVVAQLIDEGGGRRLAFDVIDTGIGIPPDQREAIFDPFVQADNTAARRHGGSGLGLPISRRIAQALGGQLMVSSKLGEGSTFRVTIDPGLLEGVRMLDVHSTDFIVTPDPLIPHHNIRIDGARILLVEDGDTNRKMLTRVLERAGGKVTAAENGHAGVDLALQQSFDAILMDMQMPLMDGYTAVALLRAQGVTLPMIALTAHALKGDKEKCMQAGCSDYLSKPVNIEKLLRTVAEAIQSSRPQITSDNPASPSPAASCLTSTLPLDDPELYEVVSEFIVQLPSKLEAMRAAWRSGDWQKLAEMAHWLKGAGGTMGFPAFTEPGNRLQQQARQQQNEGIDRLFEELTSIVARIVVPPPPEKVSAD